VHPCDELYDDIATVQDNPPELIEEDMYDDIQNGLGKAESVDSIASAISDSDDVGTADGDVGNGTVPRDSTSPEDGKNTATLSKKEMSKLKREEKEKEKQLEKERRLQKKKDEEERKQREKMEALRKKNFDKTRKPFKVKQSSNAVK
jgi:hypothetical protein